jgi:hydrogenase nickel incorporation protein HypA/HybF
VHELSVALALVDAAADQARALGAVRVQAVFVRLGARSGVVKDALLFCFDAAAQGTAIEGARLEIEAASGSEMELTALEVSDVNDVNDDAEPE